MAIRDAALVLALTLAAGCTTQTADVARQTQTHGVLHHDPAMAITVTADNVGQFAAAASDTYLVGRGDVLQIHAIDAPELTRPAGYLVESDGAIQVPFLGRVSAAERGTLAIRADLEYRLRRYLPQPQVELRILEHNARQISVIGDVNRPSRQTLTSRPLSVIDAINAAGGFAPRADMRAVTILRAGQEIAVDMEGFLNHGRALPGLRDGDVVQVRRSTRSRPAPAAQGVQVQMPGQTARHFALGPSPVTLAQLLASAGATGADAQLMRQNGTGHTAFLFAAEDATRPAVGGRFLLQDGDMLLLGAPRRYQ